MYVIFFRASKIFCTQVFAGFAVFAVHFVFKDTHREKTPSKKTSALTKSMNMDI